MCLLCGMQSYESDIFKDETFSECGRACIMEIGPDGKATGKSLVYPVGDDIERYFEK